MMYDSISAMTPHPRGRQTVRHLGFLIALTCGLVQAWSATGLAETVQFNRDIRPILADNCLACHGPDPGSRKAGLRLDTQEGAFEATPKRAAVIVPGKPEESEFWKRIVSQDPDDVMPPPKSQKALSDVQKDLLKRWILAGAPWQRHWAFLPPERPPIPQTRQSGWARTPIDAFVLAQLEAKGLSPAPEADRRTLARRLSLDLTGLPPEPEAVEEFVRNRSRTADEDYVRRLLASPHYGEHRARYWLDAARYADTHGLHFDNYREMWPYRDWVIRAFNRNQPFDQFIVDQIAGDLAPDPTDDQLIATGFQRCNMTTNEGGTIEEENLANYANDRVTTTGWVFLGLTANCAACHDHKFDPLTMRDFYSLAAFFRNTQQGGFDKNVREGEVSMMVARDLADRQRWKALPAEIEAANKARQAQAELADAAFTNWVMTVKPAGNARPLALGGESLWLPLAERRSADCLALLDGKRTSIPAPPDLEWRRGPLGPAPTLVKDRSLRLGDHADLKSNEPCSLAAWVLVPEGLKEGGAILARMGGEEEQFRGWDFFVRNDHFGLHLVHRWPAVGLKARSQEKSLRPGEWHHLAATYNGSTRADGVRLFLDGAEVPVNREKDSLEWTIHSPFPLRLGQRERSDKLDRVSVQDARIFRRRLDPAEVATLASAPRLPELLARVDFASTNNPAREALRSYFRVTAHAGWRKAATQLAALEAEQIAIRGRSAVTQIQREKPDSAPFAHILFRGQYDQPRDKVPAATPAALHPLAPDAPRNRLGLARWLVSADNPLTARVTVNRFWQEIFGVGLVKTSEDFGVMGERPPHQALLDWLAVEFQESGWDVRHLLTLIVNSAAYRQSAVTTPQKLELDPENRWLSRGPRFRMDAEMIRDYALAASGLLVRQVGGPSVKPYQPPGVWEAVAMPESNTRHYTPDPGAAGYRRSLYTFWKRAAPPPALDIFNAPSREVCTVRRERTNTPLQALATLNDVPYLEAARHLAGLAWTRSRGRPPAAIDFLARRVLARPLTDPEQTVVARTLADMMTFYREHPDKAREFVAAGSAPLPAKAPPTELAALSLVANQLLNLDEVLNK